MFRELWGLRLASFGTIDRSGGLPFEQPQVPGGREHLPAARDMSDSLIQVTLPFCDNRELFSDYVNIYGGIRFGKIMEDLDVFAATCAYMHCGTATNLGEKLVIVTAAVDRIDMHMRLDEPLNLRMKGMVTFVGRSSMEVTILVESSRSGADTSACPGAGTQQTNCSPSPHSKDIVIEQFTTTDTQPNDPHWQLASLAKFIMVARDGKGQAVEVPRLTLHTPREQAIFDAGAERHRRRLARAQESLFKEPPTAAESVLLHQLFLAHTATAPTPASTPTPVPMQHTTLTTTRICQPQERNIHDLIFGGYLMREAFELGYACGQVFSRAELHFLAVDELAFKHPVPIGALLQLTAQVVYTEDQFEDGAATRLPTAQLIHVEVVADVVDVTTSIRKTTNTFHFTFKFEQPPKFTVRPATYVEAMRYLEGKRRISTIPLDPQRQIYRF